VTYYQVTFIFLHEQNGPGVQNMINQRIQKYNKRQTKLVCPDGEGSQHSC
jgi:hypothetical protein